MPSDWQTLSDCITVETSSSPTILIIWLHGLGADGHDFESIIPELQLNNNSGIKYVFPNAPVRPVTINGGMKTRSWYDIATGGDGFTTDQHQLRESSLYIEKLIEESLASSQPPEKIFLAGFSQGGAVVLHTAIRTKFLLSGVIALSTYLPFPDLAESEMNADRSGIDIFFAHGNVDPLIKIEWAVKSRDKLVSIGANIEWYEYAMAHSVCTKEIANLSGWLQKRI